jgi:hypothetical protein
MPTTPMQCSGPRAVTSAGVDNPDATDDPTTLVEPDDVAVSSVSSVSSGSVASDELDLDAVERDLLGVEVALERLDAGTYRTDELDGRAIPDEVLERDPIARRAP